MNKVQKKKKQKREYKVEKTFKHPHSAESLQDKGCYQEFDGEGNLTYEEKDGEKVLYFYENGKCYQQVVLSEEMYNHQESVFLGTEEYFDSDVLLHSKSVEKKYKGNLVREYDEYGRETLSLHQGYWTMSFYRDPYPGEKFVPTVPYSIVHKYSKFYV